jgi:lipoic acid synthetase
MDNLRPAWLKTKFPPNSTFNRIKQLNKKLNLNTVCEQAACPNLGTCWLQSDLTYILLGKDCTRSCKFCNVRKNAPQQLDDKEPEAIARAIKELGTDFVVLTSVTRDDLTDKGLEAFLKTINSINQQCPHTNIEILIPDFGNVDELLKRIANSNVAVIGHNIETVKKLYPQIRPDSDYERSLEVLSSIKKYNPAMLTKSAILLGFGEDELDLTQTIEDLNKARADILYLGQYLSPSKDHWPVKKFYTPDDFVRIRDFALTLGFRTVVSEPLARSSWQAKKAFEEALWTCIKQ